MIPSYERLMLPLLQFAGERAEQDLTTRDASRVLAAKFSLTQEEKEALLPSGGTFIFASRVSWACTYLKKAGLLISPRRGFFRVTDRGLKVLSQRPPTIDNEFLSQFREFQEFRTRSKKERGRRTTQEEPTSDTPEEVMAGQYELHRKALAEQVLESVKSASPQFFERVVVTLLVKMGYGGTLRDAGSAVGRSGDGGIDGVIKEDKLGLDMIYIQAKRWDDKSVGSPQIDQFAGALQKRRAHKGVFLTTSTFTADALRSVSDYGSRIILIDGPAIAQLMIDYGVGVSTTYSYELKRLDSDFFDEDYSDT